jgi:hypothetical protein
MSNEPIPVVPESTAAISSMTMETAKTPTIGGSSGSGELTGKSKIKSLAELKKKSPKLYNMMMQGIATNIVYEMKDHQERLKELMRKSEEDANRR